MAHLDLYRLAKQQGVYVVDVQVNLLEDLATRVVIPLLPRSTKPTPISELNPVFDIGGTPHVMLTQSLASVPRKALGPSIGSLAVNRDAIIRGLDRLFTS